MIVYRYTLNILQYPHLFQDLLTKYLYKQNTVQWQFKPVLLLLYADWAKDSISHLAAFNITTNLYQGSEVNLRYGLIDLEETTSKAGKLKESLLLVRFCCLSGFFLCPPTSKKLRGHIGLGLSV